MRTRRTVPDQGYAWVVLVTTIFTNFVSGMLVYFVGIIHVELLDKYKDDVTTTAWAGAVFSSNSLLTAPLASWIIQQYSCQVSVILGGICLCVGFVCSAFATSIIQIVFTYGVVAGIGLGLVYTPALMIVTFYFDKYCALASGISVSGYAVGILSGSLMIQAATEEYGLTGAFLLTGAVSLNNLVFGMLFRPTHHEGKGSAAPKEDKRLLETCGFDQTYVVGHEHSCDSGSLPGAGCKKKELLADASCVKKDLLSYENSIEKGLLPDANSEEKGLLPDAKSEKKRLLSDEHSEKKDLLSVACSEKKGLLADENSEKKRLLSDGSSAKEGLLSDDKSEKERLLTDAKLEKKGLLSDDSSKRKELVPAYVATKNDSSEKKAPDAETVDCLHSKQTAHDGTQETVFPASEEKTSDATRQFNDVHRLSSTAEEQTRTLFKDGAKDLETAPPVGSSREDAEKKGLLKEVGQRGCEQQVTPANDPAQIPEHSPGWRRGRRTFTANLRGKFQGVVPLLKNTAFLSHCGHAFCSGLSMSGVYLHLPEYAILLGTTHTRAAALFVGVGILSIASRVLTGLSITSLGADPLLVSVALMGGCGAATSLFALYSATYTGQMTYACLFGLTSGGYYTLVNVLTVELVEFHLLPPAYGLLLFVMGVGYIVGPTIAGMIVDSGGTYAHSFLLLGLAAFSSAFFDLLAKLIHRKQKQQKKYAETVSMTSIQCLNTETAHDKISNGF